MFLVEIGSLIRPFQPTLVRGFEVHPHHDLQFVGQSGTELGQTGGILDGRGWVVDRTRTNDHEQPVGPPR